MPRLEKMIVDLDVNMKAKGLLYTLVLDGLGGTSVKHASIERFIKSREVQVTLTELLIMNCDYDIFRTTMIMIHFVIRKYFTCLVST